MISVQILTFDVAYQKIDFLLVISPNPYVTVDGA